MIHTPVEFAEEFCAFIQAGTGAERRAEIWGKRCGQVLNVIARLIHGCQQMAIIAHHINDASLLRP